LLLLFLSFCFLTLLTAFLFSFCICIFHFFHIFFSLLRFFPISACEVFFFNCLSFLRAFVFSSFCHIIYSFKFIFFNFSLYFLDLSVLDTFSNHRFPKI
jgi:hypothetical protein